MKPTLILIVLASCTTHYNSPVDQHRPTAVACPPSQGDEEGADQCLVDADCGGNTVCACAGTAFENYGSETRNLCVSARCQVDADCGGGELCSPSNGGCGATRYGVTDFECRTPLDTCGADVDCGVQNGRQGSCSFSPAAGYWACTFFAGCAG